MHNSEGIIISSIVHKMNLDDHESIDIYHALLWKGDRDRGASGMLNSAFMDDRDILILLLA